MTDLPRFYEGNVGKLDFSHMNEMMKRLDLLLPLVQNAAGGGGWTGKERPTVFPVYAERSAFQTSEGFYKYRWWEITVTENVMAWKDENIADEGDTQLRIGVVDEGEGGDFGLLPFNPRETEPNTDVFVEGFAIAVLVRSANAQAQVGGIRCILFPLALPTAPGVGYVRLDGDPVVATMSVGGVDRMVHEYPATFLQAESGPEGEAGLIEKASDVIAVDLNALRTNEPSISGSDTTLVPRAYDAGTIFQATKVGEDRFAFTHLIRFDVVCT